MFVTLILLFYKTTISFAQIKFSNETLELVHVVFRHGDRTPDRLYKNDAYSEKSFYPFGIGELTNIGKQRAYDLGKSIKQTYGNFIGIQYTPGLVGTLASHIPRTHTSLQLVLAGLFPPTAETQWNPKLNWNPIPYNILPPSNNMIFTPDDVCPKYPYLRKELLDTFLDSDPLHLKYHKFLTKLQEFTGEPTDLFLLSASLYSTFKSEKEFGLPLPEWSKDFFPTALEELSKESWKYSVGLGKLKILTSGYLISTIVNNTYAKIMENPKVRRTKLFLYSGHDTNIAALLFFLDSFIPHNPNYSAHIIIEIHNIGGTRFLKFLHRDNILGVYRMVPIPRCGEYCPFVDFMQMYSSFLDVHKLKQLCGK